MATNILQLLFNFTDVMVLGIAGYDVGSVGATNALINLIIGLFVGLSVSANVLVARFVGSGEKDRAEKVVGMSMLIAVVVGVVLAVVGFFCARIFLSWMACPFQFVRRRYYVYADILYRYADNFTVQFLRFHYARRRRHVASAYLFGDCGNIQRRT